jgi:hypothetical protein
VSKKGSGQTHVHLIAASRDRTLTLINHAALCRVLNTAQVARQVMPLFPFGLAGGKDAVEELVTRLDLEAFQFIVEQIERFGSCASSAQPKRAGRPELSCSATSFPPLALPEKKPASQKAHVTNLSSHVGGRIAPDGMILII